MLKTMKYKGNLSTKLFLLQYDETALTTFLHPTDDLCSKALDQSATYSIGLYQCQLSVSTLKKKKKKNHKHWRDNINWLRQLSKLNIYVSSLSPMVIS